MTLPSWNTPETWTDEKAISVARLLALSDDLNWLRNMLHIASESKTLSSDAITVTGNAGCVTVSPESGDWDTLATINGMTDGDILLLKAAAGKTIFVGTSGNIVVPGGGVLALPQTEYIKFFKVGSSVVVNNPAPMPWIPFPNTATYASSSTFTIPGNLTGIFTKGVKIWLVQTTSKWFSVSADSTYGSNVTTVTITGGSDYSLANAAIEAPYYSYANPPNFPDVFNWASAPVGWGGSPPTTVARFRIKGKVCSGDIFQSNTGTSTTTTVSFTLPVAATTVSNHEWVGPIPWCWDNGAAQACGQTRIASAGTSINCYKSGGAAWTGTGGKAVGFHFEYEI